MPMMGSAPVIPGFQSSGMNGSNAAYGASSDLTPSQHTVLAMFSNCTTNEGLHIDTVCKQLKSKMREEEARSIIEWLIEEGHLYATIDNFHAKSTAS